MPCETLLIVENVARSTMRMMPHWKPAYNVVPSFTARARTASASSSIIVRMYAKL